MMTVFEIGGFAKRAAVEGWKAAIRAAFEKTTDREEAEVR
jgi:hypothetical protein